MPGKEVGHDKNRSLAMPMGISLSELPSGVTGRSARYVGLQLLESNWKPRALRLEGP